MRRISLSSNFKNGSSMKWFWTEELFTKWDQTARNRAVVGMVESQRELRIYSTDFSKQKRREMTKFTAQKFYGNAKS